MSSEQRALPSVANYALKRVAIDNPEFSKQAKECVNNNFYVDDLLNR